MPTVDDKNFDAAMTPELRDEFWRRVKFALRHFYNASGQVADEYRTAVEERPILGQLLVYHQEPLTIAADLADDASGGVQFIDAYNSRYPDPFG